MDTDIKESLRKLRRQILHHKEYDSKTNPLFHLKKQFNHKEIDSYDFTYSMNLFSKILYYFAEYIKETDISKIEIVDNNVIFTTQEENLKIIFNGKDRGGAPFEIINYGSYEKAESELLDKLLTDGMTILDIGANIGWFSTRWAKKFPSTNIYAFEPLEETYQYLIKNIALNNLKNVKAHNFGLSNSEGEALLYYYSEASCLASTKNILGYASPNGVKCELKKLDSIIDTVGFSNIDLIKCDVEGGELGVLQGGTNAIATYLPMIVVELFDEWSQAFGYKSNTAIKFLKSFGYECFLPYKEGLEKVNNYVGNVDRYNYFFFHNVKHKNDLRKISIKI